MDAASGNECFCSKNDAFAALENNKDSFVIWDAQKKDFTLIHHSNLEAFINKLQPKDRTYHEVIPPNGPQKLRFDIDFKPEWEISNNIKFNIRKNLIREIISCFMIQN